MDYEKIIKAIEAFIKNETNGFDGGVIGLSGGIDSTATVFLAVRAIGKDNVYGLIMPYFRNQNMDDAVNVAKLLGIKYEVIDIRPNAESFEYSGHFDKKISKENLISRIRMIHLYGIANEKNMKVLGTSNKSELMTGYFTKYGDGGVDIEPLGDLYKTEVWELARFLKEKMGVDIPKNIIDKVPSADLSPDQTDEADLGMDYHTLDRILKGETGNIDKDKIEKVMALVRKSEHKRKMPPVALIER